MGYFRKRDDMAMFVSMSIELQYTSIQPDRELAPARERTDACPCLPLSTRRVTEEIVESRPPSFVGLSTIENRVLADFGVQPIMNAVENVLHTKHRCQFSASQALAARVNLDWSTSWVHRAAEVDWIDS